MGILARLTLTFYRLNSFQPLMTLKSGSSISQLMVSFIAKQNKFYSCALSSLIVCCTSDESLKWNVILIGRQFLMIMGGIRLISETVSLLKMSDLVFLMNVYFEVAFFK